MFFFSFTLFDSYGLVAVAVYEMPALDSERMWNAGSHSRIEWLCRLDLETDR